MTAPASPQPFDPALLSVLVCPETHQALTLADAALLASVNEKITAGALRNRAGQIVRDKLDACLVRSDQQYLYPVRESLPIMLIDESIPLST